VASQSFDSFPRTSTFFHFSFRQESWDSQIIDNVEARKLADGSAEPGSSAIQQRCSATARDRIELDGQAGDCPGCAWSEAQDKSIRWFKRSGQDILKCERAEEPSTKGYGTSSAQS
jgi:hypothetical protein